MKVNLSNTTKIFLSILGIIATAFIMMFFFTQLIDKLSKIGIIILGVILLIAAFLYDYVEKINKNKESLEFQRIFEIIFPNYSSEFDIFFKLYHNNKKEFDAKYKSTITNYVSFDLKNLESIELLFIFCDSKKLISIVDWRGEENEKEIEFFIENSLEIEIDWSNTIELRQKIKNKEDGEFIKMLFKSIQKDISKLNRKIIFLQMGWDSYVYTIVESEIAKKILTIYPKGFSGKIM